MRTTRFFILTILTLIFAIGCAYSPIDSVPANVSARATDYALAMVGTPYHYGGDSPSRGFDCSGLVQYSYARAGMRVPRTTSGLYRQSRTISPDELRRGDLLFFDQEGKKSSHVALYVGADRFVHAPSSGKSVHVTNFSSYWRQHLAYARRIESD